MSAEPYRGKRLRMSAFMKTENLDGSAWLWLRIDGKKKSILDNMSDRPIKGTNDWGKYECVLDVDKDAVNLVFGLGFGGNGRAWVDDFQFEIVGGDVKTTEPFPAHDISTPPTASNGAAPLNLDFEK